MYIFLVLVAVLRHCDGVIYDLNDTQYARMPKLFDMDDYGRCMMQPNARYCLLDLELTSDRPSDLLDMIRGYSEYDRKHFNHTQIHRGICIYKTCQKYLNDSHINCTEEALAAPLEACLNASIWRDYDLQAKLLELKYCLSPNDRKEVDTLDLIVAVIYVVIIVLNAMGTFYDLWFCDINSKDGNPYLLAFSLRRNWRRLTAPSGHGPDPRLNRLKLFYGLRTMTMGCVIFAHIVLILAGAYIDNPLYLERIYNDPSIQILFNGNIVTLTFFVMSAFLLSYNTLIYAEKHPITFGWFPKGILIRWMRLTPSYALVIATLATWMRHVGSGPLWHDMVEIEGAACRKYWWAHLLYINNYIYDDSQCIPQAWYLAADTQLFIMGLLLCILARTPRSQKIFLAILFIISLIIPAAQTYYQNLDAVALMSPKNYVNLFATYDSFRYGYASGHSQLSIYTLGLSTGFLVYYWQKEGKDFEKSKHKLRFFIWMLFPLGVGIILSGGFFYMDGVDMPRWFMSIYAALYKPLFQFVICLFIISSIFKIESLARGIIEWRGFTWSGRVSYSVFLVHSAFQRTIPGSWKGLLHLSHFVLLNFLASTMVMSFMCGAILWMTVESPVSQVTRAILQPRRRHLDDNITNGVTNPGLTPDGQTKL